MTRVGIVGGGVIGLCAGVSLLGRGADVTIIDDTTGPARRERLELWLARGLARASPSGSGRPPTVDPLAPVARRRRLCRSGPSRASRAGCSDSPGALARPSIGEASRRSPRIMPDALPAWQRLEREGLMIPWRTEGPLVPFLDRARLESEAVTWTSSSRSVSPTRSSTTRPLPMS